MSFTRNRLFWVAMIQTTLASGLYTFGGTRASVVHAMFWGVVFTGMFLYAWVRDP